jgi:hypothetical protein
MFPRIIQPQAYAPPMLAVRPGMFHVKHCTGYYVRIIMYVQQDSNETPKTSYETSQGAAKRAKN